MAEIKKRDSSIEIVATATEVRQKLDEKKGKGTSADDAKRELEMVEHQVDLPELAKLLNCKDTSVFENGVTKAFAAKRLEEDGKNQLTPPKTEPEWKKFLRELFSFFACLLWIGCVLCFVAYSMREDVENLYLGVVLGSVVTITACFGYFQNRKASNLMDSFKGMMPASITVVRGGEKQTIDALDLVRGDLIELKGGDKVPADVRVLGCSDNCTVDNASLTGESEPQKRSTECTDPNPLETRNLAFFGTFVPEGTLKGVIVNTGDNTVMGRIATLATQTETEKTPIAKEIEHFVHIVSGVAIFLGIAFLIIGLIMNPNDAIASVVFMIGIIVANVPEGLLATVTVCLTLTANRMHQKSVLVKNLEGVETLGSTTCICSDKTGTLTQNIMTVANLVYDGKVWEAECSLTPEGNYDKENGTFKALQRCGTLCNNAIFDENSKTTESGSRVQFKETVTLGDGSTEIKCMWKTIGDASESAMIKFVQDKRDILLFRNANEKLAEVPFNSKNKYQISIHKKEDGSGHTLQMKGAPERITARCNTVLINGEELPMTEERMKDIEDCQLTLSKQGRRVLGFCQKELDPVQFPDGFHYDTDNPNYPVGDKDVDYTASPTPNKIREQGLCFIGMMALIDPPRPQVPPAVGLCKTAGIKVIMVTGDHPITAKAIAHKVGILWGDTKEDVIEYNEAGNFKRGDPQWRDPYDQDEAPAVVVPGWTISLDTPEKEWDRILSHNQAVFARTSPQQKLIIVENCQRLGHIVAVTGDGVNDSPALKKADIGIAMGIMGSEVSKEAADMILLDDNFASIVAGIEEGRLIFDNLKKSIAYTLSSNIPEISPFLIFVVVQTPLPLTTVLILCVDLGTDMIPAISMAYETPESDIMQRPPRNAAVDRLVTKKLVSFAYLQIGVIQAAAGFFTWMTVLNDYGYAPHLLPGLGANLQWGKVPMYCKLKYGEYCNEGYSSETLKCVRVRDAEYKKYIKESWNKDVFVDDYASGEYWGEDGVGCMFKKTGTPMLNESANGVCKGAYPFWRKGTDGEIVDCQFAWQNYLPGGPSYSFEDSVNGGFDEGKVKNGFTEDLTQTSAQSYGLARKSNYVPYYPYRSRLSPFYDSRWWAWPASAGKIPREEQAPGFMSPKAIVAFSFQPVVNIILAEDCKADKDVAFDIFGNQKAAFEGQASLLPKGLGASTCNKGSITNSFTATVSGTLSDVKTTMAAAAFQYPFIYKDSEKYIYSNIFSRMSQKEALHHAQGAFWGSIVVVQWADLVICKTRWLSIRTQGMSNNVMNFGLFFETMLSGWLAYIPAFNTAFGTRNIRFTHWFCAMPFSMLIFTYDEIRKYLMRTTSPAHIDKQTGRSIREPGWLERNTYY